MATIATRLAGILSGTASRVERLAQFVRGAEESRIADMPGGLGRYIPPRDSRTARLLESWGAYSARVTPSAGPVQTRWALWPADGLTPEQIIRAQREAVASGIPLLWVELIDQVYSRDGHYASCTDQRVADVIKGTWRLLPAVADDAGIAAANFVDEVYRNCARWNDGFGWLLYSNLYSYTATEVEWAEQRMTFRGPRGETIGPVDVAVPVRLHNAHPKHFRFDLYNDDPYFWIGNSYQNLPIGKFIFSDGAGLHPIKARRGHAWQCVWYSMFRSIGWSGWATWVDRFAMPVPVLEFEGGLAQYPEYQQAMEDIQASLGTGKGVRYPRNHMKLDLKDPPRGGGSSDPHSALSDACDAAQSVRTLGAQLNNKIGNVGSFAASTNHLDIKFALEEMDAARSWERVDEQLTRPLLMFNAEALADALRERGYQVTPQQMMRRVSRGKHHIPGKTDPLTEMQIADLAVNKLGLSISMHGLFARMDFERAREESDRVPGAPQQVSSGGKLVGSVEASQEGAEAPKEPHNTK